MADETPKDRSGRATPQDNTPKKPTGVKASTTPPPDKEQHPEEQSGEEHTYYVDQEGIVYEDRTDEPIPAEGGRTPEEPPRRFVSDEVDPRRAEGHSADDWAARHEFDPLRPGSAQSGPLHRGAVPDEPDAPGMAPFADNPQGERYRMAGAHKGAQRTTLLVAGAIAAVALIVIIAVAL